MFETKSHICAPFTFLHAQSKLTRAIQRSANAALDMQSLLLLDLYGTSFQIFVIYTVFRLFIFERLLLGGGVSQLRVHDV